MSQSLRSKLLITLSIMALTASACVSNPATQDIVNENDNQYAEEEIKEPESEIISESEQTLSLGAENQVNIMDDESQDFLLPGDPPEALRILEDSDSSLRAAENRVLSGDNFQNNLFERPFTSQEMVYQPDLDIRTVSFTEDDQFFYFTITLGGMNPQEWGLQGLYGIEFDLTLSGRGDLIVSTEAPGEQWSNEHLIALMDTDGDIGGPRPIIPDTGFNGSGYDNEVSFSENSVAWARMAPDDTESIQIAVSRDLLGNPEEFTWGAWADNGLRDFGQYDYNDQMSASQAGSPFRDSEDYPVNLIFNLDNTCRLPYGLPQIGSTIPGVCISLPPAPEPEKSPSAKTCPPGTVLQQGQCVIIN